MSVRFQPLDPEFLRDPYPTYALLRAESPIHRVRMSPVAIGRMLWRTARERSDAYQAPRLSQSVLSR